MVDVEDVNFRFGFECALELCLSEAKGCRNKADGVKRLEGLLELVKDDKIGRLKDMLASIKR